MFGPPDRDDGSAPYNFDRENAISACFSIRFVCVVVTRSPPRVKSWVIFKTFREFFFFIHSLLGNNNAPYTETTTVVVTMCGRTIFSNFSHRLSSFPPALIAGILSVFTGNVVHTLRVSDPNGRARTTCFSLIDKISISLFANDA